MKGRGFLVYAVFVVAACAAVAVVLTQRRTAQRAEDAAKNPAPQVVRIPTPSQGPQPGTPGTLPPGLAPLPPGAGPQRGPLPFRTDGAGKPPFMGGVTQQAVVDLNSAPVSALVTLPGITPEYAKKIVEHRPYRDRPDLEAKTGLPHDVVEKLGPPAMIRSVSTEPFPKK
jgi:helix-hairpin-helix protein